MDIIQGPAIRRVPDVHPPRPVPAPVATMVRVAVMAVVQTLVRAVRHLRHVHVQLKPRHVPHHVRRLRILHRPPVVVNHVQLQMVQGRAHIQIHVLDIIPAAVVHRRAHPVRDVPHMEPAPAPAHVMLFRVIQVTARIVRGPRVLRTVIPVRLVSI